MAKTWVLETQTKGTGATVIPLDSVLRKRAAEDVPGFVLPDLRPPPGSPPEPRRPRAFRVMDVMTRQVLVEGDVRAAVSVLEDIRSIVDVRVAVWEPTTERWRMLTFGETKTLWEYRGQIGAGEPTDTSGAPER